jgi:hypothetical protein
MSYKKISEDTFQHPNQNIPFHCKVYLDEQSKALIVLAEQFTDVSDQDFLSTRENRVRESTKLCYEKFDVRQENVFHVEKASDGRLYLLDVKINENLIDTGVTTGVDKTFDISSKGEVSRGELEKIIGEEIAGPQDFYSSLKTPTIDREKEKEQQFEMN